MKNMVIRITQIFTLIVAFLMISACAVNPVTGKKQLNLMGEQQEIQLGASYDPQVVAQFGLYQNDAIQKFINEKGQEMAKISHRPQLKWTFRVVDSPVVNAFAVPGGYVYFTRGILAHFNNEAEFAGVLGHEIGHVTARHAASQYTKQTLGQVLFIGGLIVSKEFREFADVAQQSLGLLFLKFSRDDESQSDELGVEYSTKIGYDAVEMADFFRTLSRLSAKSGASDIPTFMSTHPNPMDRYNKVGKMANEWQGKSEIANYEVNRDEYLRMIDGLIYGEDPRQGYVENNRFYHPELKFQYPIPVGWQTQNSASQVQMAPKDGKALMILTLSPDSDLQTAAQNIVQQFELTPVDSRSVTVNGMPAIAMLNDQITQDPNTGKESALRIQTYCIQYNGAIYVIHGLAARQDFQRYQNQFNQTMKGFNKLTDASKINVMPEKVKIVSVKSNGTFQQALNGYQVPSARQEEFAILNGMELKDQVQAGQLIKIIGK
jgi:predicted Zn-dependent protease